MLFQSPQGVWVASHGGLAHRRGNWVSVPARGMGCIGQLTQGPPQAEQFQSPQGVWVASASYKWADIYAQFQSPQGVWVASSALLLN